MRKIVTIKEEVKQLKKGNRHTVYTKGFKNDLIVESPLTDDEFDPMCYIKLGTLIKHPDKVDLVFEK